ncbi:formate dehydrogenase accessory sulfurtransferase FdhD [Halomonas sp. PAMB 3232]|uniref:formate dehydrogenase accessory sulfurtransferase FdhD n=1 Tax=Halomonas sp. PAMB 3232 TaxID=3075221 RepID=UPI0028A1979E|nr:formate dehydrogenase accessory sulfurtransferase FdhD [Halomonas sp. PAMB 3232]WNL39229.1 formate dehydrogenase accessory sulfurtransferase FdhD [Halomonas sp. PAMB 3232]
MNATEREEQALARLPVEVRRHQSGWQADVDEDALAEEVPVALIYNGISHAVMMASPSDLMDLALGFSLTEGIIAHSHECYDWEVKEEENGLAVHLTIATERLMALKERRRSMTGRTGCGLCGTEALDQAIRPIPEVRAPALTDAAIARALDAFSAHQPLKAATGAVHGAAWCSLEGEILHVREDVGRHNALDKLIGALAREKAALDNGFVLVSSRASYEMVHKCASAGIGALVAVSAATALAVRQAQAAKLLLVGFARRHRHVIYHRPSAAPSKGATLCRTTTTT